MAITRSNRIASKTIGTLARRPELRMATALGLSILAVSLLSLQTATFGQVSQGRPAPMAVTQPPDAQFSTNELPLPGAKGLVTLDYFAWDRLRRRLWVPAGNLGSVQVIDGNTDAITSISGFKTAEVELRNRKVTIGPTSVSIAKGFVFVGNRADSSICAIDATTMKLGDCIRVGSPSEGLAAAPDGIIYVAPTKELWITRGAPPLGIPSLDKSITIFDASTPRLKQKTKIQVGGSAEGYAVDARRGVFYTNLEETRETIAIDIRRREIVSRWNSGCDEPRGLALDKTRGHLFVACSDRVVSLDTSSGIVVDSISTGDGLDNIDYSEGNGLLYAAASRVGKMTVARVDSRGKLQRVAEVPTATGARGVVVDGEKTAYVADPVNGRILKITPRQNRSAKRPAG
jgi:DNA-binding beta-propeller fold protein YncE